MTFIGDHRRAVQCDRRRAKSHVVSIDRADGIRGHDAVVIREARCEPCGIVANGHRGARAPDGDGCTLLGIAETGSAPLEPRGRGRSVGTDRGIELGHGVAHAGGRQRLHQRGFLVGHCSDVHESPGFARNTALVGGRGAGRGNASLDGRGAGQRRSGLRGTAVVAQNREDGRGHQDIRAGDETRAVGVADQVHARREHIARGLVEVRAAISDVESHDRVIERERAAVVDAAAAAGTVPPGSVARERGVDEGVGGGTGAVNPSAKSRVDQAAAGFIARECAVHKAECSRVVDASAMASRGTLIHRVCPTARNPTRIVGKGGTVNGQRSGVVDRATAAAISTEARAATWRTTAIAGVVGGESGILHGEGAAVINCAPTAPRAAVVEIG